MPIEQNKLGSYVTTRDTASATYTVASLTANASIETVTAAKITEIYWSGGWTVARGAGNVVLDLSTSSGGEHWKFGGDFTISANSVGDLVLTRTSANGTIIVVLDKTRTETYLS